MKSLLRFGHSNSPTQPLSNAKLEQIISLFSKKGDEPVLNTIQGNSPASAHDLPGTLFAIKWFQRVRYEYSLQAEFN